MQKKRRQLTSLEIRFWAIAERILLKTAAFLGRVEDALAEPDTSTEEREPH